MKKYNPEDFCKITDELMSEFRIKSEKSDSDLESAYKILSPFPNSYFADGTIKMSDAYDVYLWDMKINQIKNFVPVRDIYQIDSIIAYCRARYLRNEVERIIRRDSISDECDVCVYVDGGCLFDQAFPYTCSKIYVRITWIDEDETFYFRIYPSSAGFFSYQLKEDPANEPVEESNMTISEIRELLKISRAEFSRRYNIPLRTLENWESGVRTPPDYVVSLLERVVLEDTSGN